MKIKATVNIFLANQGVQQQLNIKLRLINTKFQLRWLLNSLMQLIWSYLSLAKILKVYHRLLMFSFVLFIFFKVSLFILTTTAQHMKFHGVKRVQIRSYSGPYFSRIFPAFRLNTERYVFGVILVRIFPGFCRIRTEYREIQSIFPKIRRK